MKINSDDIDLIVYDFDGVMTDNRVILFQDGTEAVIVKVPSVPHSSWKTLGLQEKSKCKKELSF